MAETLKSLSFFALSAALMSLGLTVFFWFFFRIPAVIGDLTGRTARKAIEKMRAVNRQSGRKTYRVSTVNAVRGRVTADIPQAQGEGEEKPASGRRGRECRTGPATSDGQQVEPKETEPIDLTETAQLPVVMIDEVLIIHTGDKYL